MRKRELEQRLDAAHKAFGSERERRLHNENLLIRLGLIPEHLQRDIEKVDYGPVEYRPLTHPLPERVIDWDAVRRSE